MRCVARSHAHQIPLGIKHLAYIFDISLSPIFGVFLNISCHLYKPKLISPFSMYNIRLPHPLTHDVARHPRITHRITRTRYITRAHATALPSAHARKNPSLDSGIVCRYSPFPSMPIPGVAFPKENTYEQASCITDPCRNSYAVEVNPKLCKNR